jgi:hypothetical protein
VEATFQKVGGLPPAQTGLSVESGKILRSGVLGALQLRESVIMATNVMTMRRMRPDLNT